jgi:hypothetical protein
MSLKGRDAEGSKKIQLGLTNKADCGCGGPGIIESDVIVI